MESLIIFCCSVALALLLVPLMIKAAPKLNLMDSPDKKLKNHSRPIPITGGYVLALVVTLLFIYLFLFKTIHVNFIVGFYIMFLLGMIDDFKRLSPVPKLIVESMVAGGMIFTGNSMDVAAFPKLLNYFLTFLWIVGIMNAINLLDIMDALASTVALIISLTLLFINISSGNQWNIIVLSALSGFLLSFLLFNKPPAKTYLGDCGSLIIGFVLSYVSINTKYTSINNVAFLTPVLIFGIPIYDTFFVSAVRILKGKSPLHGSPDHLAIKMKSIISRKGFIVFVIGLLQSVLSLFAFLSTIVSTFWAMAIYLFVMIVLTRIGFYVNSIKES